MKQKIDIIFQIISVGLLIYLLLFNISNLDFASTKNDHLAALNKTEIESYKHIDSIKVKAKEIVELNRKNYKKRSANSLSNIYIIITILLIQLIRPFLKSNTGRTRMPD